MADKKISKISDYQDLEQRFQTLSVIVSRANLAAKLGMSYNDKRDLYQALGYPLTLVYDDFASKWSRQDIVRAVVDKPIKATWRKGVQLMESDKANETTFEKEWKDLSKRLKLPNVFARADRLSSFGNYAVLMLGFNDVTTPEDFAKPVQQGSRQLNYVHPYGMKNATIQTWDEDPTSERYGLPTQYQITTSAPGTNATITYLVHFTRIVHIVDDQLESDVEGYCRLEPLYNRFVDLEKLIGGSAEMFWRGARPGYQGKVDENYTMSTETKEDLKNQIDEFEHNLRRILVNQGVDLTSLQQQIADPATHVDIQIQMISAVTGIPKRILVGSERGELSSSQDQDAWFQVIDSRREDFAEPCILRPFVEKCILYGILSEPTSGDYDVEWPDVFEQSDEEKAKVGGLRATALKDYCASPIAESVVPPKAFFEFFLGFEEEDIELIEAMVEEGMSAEEAAMKKLGMTPEQLDAIKNPQPVPNNTTTAPSAPRSKAQGGASIESPSPAAHSFPGHQGRPGQVGGSLPKGAVSAEEVDGVEKAITFAKKSDKSKETLIFVDESGKSFKSAGGHESVDLSKDQEKMMKEGKVTSIHTHPEDATFSGSDLQQLRNIDNIKEIIAVSPSTVYRLQRTGPDAHKSIDSILSDYKSLFVDKYLDLVDDGKMTRKEGINKAMAEVLNSKTYPSLSYSEEK